MIVFSLEPYMAEPHPELDLKTSLFNAKVSKVPVIAMFCKDEQATRVVHLHGIYPYFYIPYSGSHDVDGYIHDLKNAINQALAIYVGKVDDYVPGILRVKGIPFYGFHAGYKYFLKIYLYNPWMISKLVNLMEKGWILGTKFQTYHSHLSFVLQFMIDFEIYGMGSVEFKAIVNNHAHAKDILRKVRERPLINLISNTVVNNEKYVPSLDTIWVSLNY
jgi:DNA polymerase zeta